MDPTENLREQRRLSQELSDNAQLPESTRVVEFEAATLKGERLAELVQALDEWITGGGFLPEQWQKARRA